MSLTNENEELIANFLNHDLKKNEGLTSVPFDFPM